MILMCNRRFTSSRQSLAESEDTQVNSFMDSPTLLTQGSLPSSNDENPRVKFLCSFNGSILPRPQDGKLRYVGGETRIVSVPRDISYEELMERMKELFEVATVLKYQQPDEDLDALVSVVNDDDVTNMMEEYDKMGSGDGFTRLRIFLFSNPDQDDPLHFVDADERDNERRYVDALNSLNESPDFRKQQTSEFQVMGHIDDIQLTEQYFNQMNLEGSLHNQRSYETLMPQVNLRHLTIPRMGSVQLQQSANQRYGEMEPPWSPAYYSPRHPGHIELPTSPSSGRYHTPYGEFSDKIFDRIPEEYSRQQVNHQSPYEQQPQVTENVAWFPPGPLPGDKAGFPGNILNGSSVFEGNSVCDHCRLPFPRNQAFPDSQPNPELPNLGNGFHQVANPCAECPPNRETYMPNPEAKFHHPFYTREQNDPRSLYNDTNTHERGWMLQNQLNPRVDEPRQHNSSLRLNDHYMIDSNGMNISIGPGNFPDGYHVPSHYVRHEDRPRYIRHGPEFGNEVFHDQPVPTGSSHIHMPLEERGVRYGNLPYGYGAENLYQAPHAQLPPQALWRNVHTPVHGGPSYEASCIPQQESGMCSPVFIRGTMEGSSPRFRVGAENQNPWVESSHTIVGVDGSAVQENTHGHSLKMMPCAYNLENQPPIPPNLILSPPDLVNYVSPSDTVVRSDSAPTLTDEKLVSLTTSRPERKHDASVTDLTRTAEKSNQRGGQEIKDEAKVGYCNMQSVSGPEQKKEAIILPTEKINGAENLVEDTVSSAPHNGELQVECLDFLPELIESVKKTALEDVEEVKAEVKENADPVAVHDETVKEENESEAAAELELDSDNDNQNNSKIEPTKAEEEAISRGLQTIKNDDLEEIRELGSGTYGAVYHGKWKGSDVAIKRIKASCFAGRPSERQRLIADFWKEALILSSLHHPNVVSFYGIVRDGPDGSLATVTEFMINGSLKQFLQKKDRTIDRRKRLIIAMDAAFGMEYLHGKNIVHFDLKCENLLVNMRDPHRPVCKIGDLGLSKVKQHTLVSGGVRGTLPWMAPELLSGKSHMVTEKIDVYSFGIVMWELLTGDEPYTDMHCASIIGGIVNNTLRPQIPTWCDPEWKALMESCWGSEPALRPSFSEISQKLRIMAAAINVK